MLTEKKISLLVFLLLLLDTFRCSLEGKVETIEACCWLRVEKSVFEMLSQKVSVVWVGCHVRRIFARHEVWAKHFAPARRNTHTHKHTQKGGQTRRRAYRMHTRIQSLNHSTQSTIIIKLTFYHGAAEPKRFDSVPRENIIIKSGML